MSNEWHVESADPEVGIFSENIFHQNCLISDEDNNEWSEVTSDSVFKKDGDKVIETVTWTCQCGAIHSFNETWNASDFETEN